MLRLYDTVESERHFATGETLHVLLVLDEGEPAIVDGGVHVVHEEYAGATPLDAALVDHWLDRRNDVSALESSTTAGYVVDTFEIAARWRDLPRVTDEVLTAMRAVDDTLVCSVHQSHAYGDGACCYFTFAGQPPPDGRAHYYDATFDAGLRAVVNHGAAISHHHGVGLNRARFMADSLGAGFGVLAAIKRSLDAHGILNPGKLGLPDPFAA